ncbi:MAG: COQ9 family protein, partial [Paracoccaceae bacterium]
MTGTNESLRDALLDAALPHVTFDGWGPATLQAAALDARIDAALLPVILPRGGLDLAVVYHRRGDAEMVAKLAAMGMDGLKFRDRVAAAVRLRLEVGDRDIVRRGAALFSLPQNMPLGAQMLWGTADAIWRALGDNATDINWYSKRATLSAVYSSAVLYWLGDESEGQAETWAFIDRRIGDVMQFEKAKARFRASGAAKLLAGPMGLLARIKAPEP